MPPCCQVIRLAFTLPPPGDTETLDRFLNLACLLTDLVGSYKLGPGGWVCWHVWVGGCGCQLAYLMRAHNLGAGGWV